MACKTKWIASQEAYIKACEGRADALDGWNTAEEVSDLAVMAAEAATSKVLSAKERILELEDLITSQKTRLGTEKVWVNKVWSLAERLVAAEDEVELLEAELQEKAKEVSMSEVTSLVWHTALEDQNRVFPSNFYRPQVCLGRRGYDFHP